MSNKSIERQIKKLPPEAGRKGTPNLNWGPEIKRFKSYQGSNYFDKRKDKRLVIKLKEH
jgi:hypothetical protein